MATAEIELTNHDLVGKGLQIVREALAPYVHRELSRVFGGKWWTNGVLLSVSEMQAGKLPQSGAEKDLIKELDVAALLTVIDRRWGDVFAQKLPRVARNYVIELQDSRNRWAHAKGAVSDNDAWRALDTMGRLLEAASLQGVEDISRLAEATRRNVYRQPAPIQVVPEVPKPKPTQTTQSAMDFGLRPWREVMIPHEDVTAGRFQQSQFAANLADVISGKAPAEYGDPSEFFARTYLTAGIRNLLTAALQRLGGEGGEPVVQLKTAFGGGKTHTMLALYHLVRGKGKIDRLHEIKALMERAGVSYMPKAKTAVLVGTALGTGAHLDMGGHGIEVRTLWGEMAAQIGGAEAYALVREEDERGVAPGANTMVDLFDRFGPCVVLIDELVVYARNIYGVQGLAAGSFDSIMTFVHNLTEAMNRSRRSMVVAAIPESDMEAGGEAGKIVLGRIEHTFGRLEAVWKSADALEGFEIVRRRLFRGVKDEAAREQTCLGFSRLYAGDTHDFPGQCGEGPYLERLRTAYPIHPELFDRLYDDWSSLPTFQRTRGVLRLMAACIHELWISNDQSLMIMPGSLPLDAPRVRDEFMRYLPDGWNAVIDHDVAGERSEPRRIDEENQRFGERIAAERVARAIFLGSAPHGASGGSGQTVHGVEDVRVRLGVAQPNEPIAVFNDALGRLVDRLTYLYSASGRYWYDTHPNLRRTAEDRASRYDPYDVQEEIIRRLRASRDKADFAGVHVCPGPAGDDVPDEQASRLVVLRPDATFTRTRNDPAALDVARHILEHRGALPRTYRNTLLFLAPDATAMEGLDREVRRYLAWGSILRDEEHLNLDRSQLKEAKEAHERANGTVDLRVREAYVWLIVPAQPEGTAWTLEPERLSSGDASPAARAARAAVASGNLVTSWGPALLRKALDDWLWKDRDHISVKQLWEYLCTYGYLSRLKDVRVLQETIAAGVRDRDYFAYAGSVSNTGRYEALRLETALSPTEVHVDGSSVLLKPEVAEAQERRDEEERRRKEDDERRIRGETPGGTGRTDSEGLTQQEQPRPPEPPTPSRVRSFRGKVVLNPNRVAGSAATIANEIIQHLNAIHGAEVEVTLTIEAAFDEDVPEGTVRDVSENANVLKFTEADWERW